MRRPCVFVMLLPLLLLAQAGTGAQQKVLLLPPEDSERPDYMIANEANVMISALVQAGYQVDVATESGASIRGLQLTLDADLKISEVNLDNYAGVLIPCMAAIGVGEGTHPPRDVVDLVGRAAKRGMIIGAQAGSVIILADAGLLAGRRYTCYQDPSSYGKEYSDGQYVGKGVVRDSNIIVSGNCPWATWKWGYKDGTAELLAEFIRAIQEH